jgi:hypothetical protein
MMNDERGGLSVASLHLEDVENVYLTSISLRTCVFAPEIRRAKYKPEGNSRPSKET